MTRRDSSVTFPTDLLATSLTCWCQAANLLRTSR